MLRVDGQALCPLAGSPCCLCAATQRLRALIGDVVAGGSVELESCSSQGLTDLFREEESLQEETSAPRCWGRTRCSDTSVCTLPAVREKLEDWPWRHLPEAAATATDLSEARVWGVFLPVAGAHYGCCNARWVWFLRVTRRRIFFIGHEIFFHPCDSCYCATLKLISILKLINIIFFQSTWTFCCSASQLDSRYHCI